MAKRPSLANNMKALTEPTAPDPVALVTQAKAAEPPAATVVRQPRQTKESGGRYAGMKKALIPLDPELHQQLRMIALRQSTTFEKVMQAAAAEYAKRHAV